MSMEKERFKGSVMTYPTFLKEVEKFEDYRDKAICWLMWSGFKDDIENWQNYTSRDLSRSGDMFFLKGKEISKECYEVLLMASNENTYHAIANKQYTIRPLIESNHLVKETQVYSTRCRDSQWNGYGMTSSSIRNRFSTLRRKFNIKYPLSAIALSGIVREALNNSYNKDSFISYLALKGLRPTTQETVYHSFLKALPLYFEEDYQALEGQEDIIENYSQIAPSSDMAKLLQIVQNKQKKEVCC